MNFAPMTLYKFYCSHDDDDVDDDYDDDDDEDGIEEKENYSCGTVWLMKRLMGEALGL